MKKKIIVFNILFLICELVGLGIIMLSTNRLLFEYYTVDSNLFALIVTLVYLYYLLWFHFNSYFGEFMVVI